MIYNTYTFEVRNPAPGNPEVRWIHHTWNTENAKMSFSDIMETKNTTSPQGASMLETVQPNEGPLIFKLAEQKIPAAHPYYTIKDKEGNYYLVTVANAQKQGTYQALATYLPTQDILLVSTHDKDPIRIVRSQQRQYAPHLTLDHVCRQEVKNARQPLVAFMQSQGNPSPSTISLWDKWQLPFATPQLVSNNGELVCTTPGKNKASYILYGSLMFLCVAVRWVGSPSKASPKQQDHQAEEEIEASTTQEEDTAAA